MALDKYLIVVRTGRYTMMLLASLAKLLLRCLQGSLTVRAQPEVPEVSRNCFILWFSRQGDDSQDDPQWKSRNWFFLFVPLCLGTQFYLFPAGTRAHWLSSRVDLDVFTCHGVDHQDSCSEWKGLGGELMHEWPLVSCALCKQSGALATRFESLLAVQTIAPSA